MLEWSWPQSYLGVVDKFGYIEQIMGEWVLVVFAQPHSIEQGRYATLEAAQAAAEVIYSTRSQP